MPKFELPLIVLRGAGDLASGVALRLYRAGLTKILLLETANPLAVRRTVAFSEAVYTGSCKVEEVQATLVQDVSELETQWQAGRIPLLVDPEGKCLTTLQATVLVDAILAKRNIGTHKGMADFVVGLGPGFTAGQGAHADVHAIVETMRGHYLGRVIYEGAAIANTGAPAPVQGYSIERVFWAEEAGVFSTSCQIGDVVEKGAVVGTVQSEGQEQVLRAHFRGVIRGLLRDQTPVNIRTKVADVDPRADIDYCDQTSDKALAIGGGVLEAIMQYVLQADAS